MTSVKPPFPWFGGKSHVAPQIWEALGDPAQYVEPFAGSLAALLGRPDTHSNTMSTVNDLDGAVTNFWRATQSDPQAVATWADNPVNEIDLTARHIWLVEEGLPEMRDRMLADPDYSDPKIAGWWVWGLCCWIGVGWCTGRGKWGTGVDGKISDLNAGRGVNRQLPHLAGAGRGVKRPGTQLVEYISDLSERLADTRICSGDWSRYVTDATLSYGATVGVFLDPPYSGTVRTKGIYSVDDHTISGDVREWALANGHNPRYRIVLAGYAPEHDHLIPDTWRRIRWSSTGAFTNSTGNRHLETLWCSPHCIQPAEATLF